MSLKWILQTRFPLRKLSKKTTTKKTYYYQIIDKWERDSIYFGGNFAISALPRNSYSIWMPLVGAVYCQDVRVGCEFVFGGLFAYAV